MKKIIVFVLLSTSVFASSFIEVESKYDAVTTVKKISSEIEKKDGFSVFIIIDHQKNAQKIGMKLPFEQLIIFGNPKGGTKLMQADALMGYELPMKIMVYEKDAKVMVAYKSNQYIANNYNVKNSPILPKIKKVMKYFVSSVKK